MDLANPGIMAEFSNLPTVNDTIQRTLLGQQNIQQNDNVLAQQQRAEQARQATAIATDPNADPAHRDAAMNALQQADAPAAAALRQQMQQRQALAAYYANPTAAGTMQLLSQFPGLKEEVSKGWDIYSGAAKEAKLALAADAYNYLRNGDAAAAAKAVKGHMEADQAAGLPIDGYQDLLDVIETNPTVALGHAGMLLAGADPTKFAENYGKVGERERADQLQPSLVRKGVADATTAEVNAQYAAPKIESDLATADAQRTRMQAQTANEQADLVIKRSALDLDRDKLNSTMQLELAKMDQAGTQLDAGGRQAVNTAVGESVGAQALADRMNTLADQMKTAGASSGWKAAFYEKAKGAFGEQDAVSGLRSTYNQLVNQQAVKNLPPGPASDKDIALAKQGFPPDTANADYLASFLRGMAKMQSAVGAAADRKANWLNMNGGSLGALRRDTDIAGVTVPAGTTFTEFNTNAVRRGRQGDMPAGLTGVLQKYGGR